MPLKDRFNEASRGQSILGNNLILRTYRREDTDSLLTFLKADNFAAMKFLSLTQKSDEAYTEIFNSDWIRDRVFDWFNEGDSGHDGLTLGIFDKSQSRIVGTLALYTDRLQNIRLSYMVLPSERGKGLAGEAYKICHDWLWNKMNLDINYSEVDPDNNASINLLEKMGFIRIEERPSITNNALLGEIQVIYQRPPRAPA